MEKGTLHREDGGFVAEVIFRDPTKLRSQRRDRTKAGGEIPVTKSGRGSFEVVGNHGSELADQVCMLLRRDDGNEMRIEIMKADAGEFRPMGIWSPAAGSREYS